MLEIPRRLAPTRETLRELYLKSGNRCAFPKCPRALFNAKGVFVGQICHIEAAEQGGERFNINQTNEERRHASNLTLMCYDHHVETNNVSKYPVERMRRIKEEHEKVFSDVVGLMLLSVTDHTTLTEPVFAKNLKKLDAAFNWSSTEEERAETLEELRAMTVKFSQIPIPTRDLFLVLVTRGKTGIGSGLQVSEAEVQQATNLSSAELTQCISILDDYGFVFNAGVNDFSMQMVGISKLRHQWDVWSDLKEFCTKTGVSLSQIIRNLDFSVLDE